MCLTHVFVGLQFRYATCLEVLLMLIGLMCAAAHGVALPLMCVVFGEMTDSFVISGQQYNITGIFNSTIPIVLKDKETSIN